MFKVAASTDLPVVEGIMKRIHDEDPSYWPFGLSTDHFNGGLYMVQKSAGAEPVGFVGWQQFPEDGRNIGYYAIGILPEHRQRGFAKQAVAQVIREIGNQCDEVKAMVMEHNKPSMALARSLDIEVLEKAASGKEKALMALLGLGTGTATDMLTYGDDGIVGRLRGKGDFDSKALADFALNTLAGGAAGSSKLSPTTRFAAPLAAQATTIGFAGSRNAREANRIAADQVDATKSIADATASGGGSLTTGGLDIPKSVLYGAGALGAGAIGVSLFKAIAKAKADRENRDLKKRELDQAEEGKVHVTLPTEKPGDVETLIELPVGDLNLSKTLRGNLGRDTRRRLIEETRKRTRKRVTKAASAEGIATLADELNFYKHAAAGGPAPGVPAPPAMGMNPALRTNPAAQMQHQQATANSIDTSTQANPQIMKAQQAASEAQMQGQQAAAQAEANAQQQVAAQEQKAVQSQMDMTAKHQSELAKRDSEIESLKLENEKQKQMKELSDAQGKLNAQGTAGEVTAAQRVNQARIDRIGKKVGQIGGSSPAAPIKKVAAAAPAEKKPALLLRPDVANKINASPGATQWLHTPTSSARASFGPLDGLLGFFGLPNKLFAPSPDYRKPISRAEMTTHPDAWGMIGQLYQKPPEPPKPGLLDGMLGRI